MLFPPRGGCLLSRYSLTKKGDTGKIPELEISYAQSKSKMDYDIRFYNAYYLIKVLNEGFMESLNNYHCWITRSSHTEKNQLKTKGYPHQNHNDTPPPPK